MAALRLPGARFLDLGTGADLSPLIGFSVPVGEVSPDLFGQPKGRLLRIGFAEDNHQDMYTIRSYWSATIPDAATVADLPLSSAQWSAAFVSWVMCRSGFSETQFPQREAHVQYIGTTYADERAYGETAQNVSAYLARPAAGTPVHAGDLACFSSYNITFATLSIFAEGAHAPSHCDIVVGYSHDGARVLAIGGNVQQSVTMRVFAARREGQNVYLKTPQD